MISEPMPDAQAILAKHDAYAAACRDCLRTNLDSLLATLSTAAVRCVTITFDGSGDSGQIEDIECDADHDPLSDDTISVDWLCVGWHEPTPERVTRTLRDAIETFAYEVSTGAQN